MEAADLVLRAAFRTTYGRKDNIQRYLEIQPSCAFVAKKDNDIVGFGGAMDFGPFSYIGLMAVDPKVQRQGVGGMVLQEIMNWLEERKCPTWLLDASPYGGPLYEKFGFIDSDLTLVLQQKNETNKPVKREITPTSTITERDFPALVSFDTPRFGAGRFKLLHTYFEDDPARFLVSRDESGPIDGFLCAQSRVIGPWIVSNQGAAEKLLINALSFPFEDSPTVFVSALNNEALKLLSQYGFEKIRTQRHMYKGRPISRDRHGSIYGQATLGFG